jgi:hypothetical protein
MVPVSIIFGAIGLNNYALKDEINVIPKHVFLGYSFVPSIVLFLCLQ